jgi:hypothetical protein
MRKLLLLLSLSFCGLGLEGQIYDMSRDYKIIPSTRLGDGSRVQHEFYHSKWFSEERVPIRNRSVVVKKLKLWCVNSEWNEVTHTSVNDTIDVFYGRKLMNFYYADKARTPYRNGMLLDYTITVNKSNVTLSILNAEQYKRIYGPVSNEKFLNYTWVDSTNAYLIDNIPSSRSVYLVGYEYEGYVRTTNKIYDEGKVALEPRNGIGKDHGKLPNPSTDVFLGIGRGRQSTRLTTAGLNAVNEFVATVLYLIKND